MDNKFNSSCIYFDFLDLMPAVNKKLMKTIIQIAESYFGRSALSDI